MTGSQVQITIALPSVTVADAGDYIDLANDLLRRVRRVSDPGTSDAQLALIAQSNTPFVTATTADSLNPTSANTTRTTAAGGAAGDITVAGVTAAKVLLGVIAIKDADQSVLDLTTEFTTASGKINNTGGTATTGYHLAIVYR